MVDVRLMQDIGYRPAKKNSIIIGAPDLGGGMEDEQDSYPPMSLEGEQVDKMGLANARVGDRYTMEIEVEVKSVGSPMGKSKGTPPMTLEIKQCGEATESENAAENELEGGMEEESEASRGNTEEADLEQQDSGDPIVSEAPIETYDTGDKESLKEPEDTKMEDPTYGPKKKKFYSSIKKKTPSPAEAGLM